MALEKKDVLLTVSTGAGKSMVYILLGLTAKNQRVVLVISPTVELIKNQLLEMKSILTKLEKDALLQCVGLGTVSTDAKDDQLAAGGRFRSGKLCCLSSTQPFVQSS